MPISGNVTAFVGQMSQTDGGDIFMFWNYGYRKFFVVQAIGVQDYTSNEDHRRIQSNYLEKVQTCLPTVDFEHGSSWSYLIDTSLGPRIIQKSREPYRIPCDFLWAPRADISEIDMITLWRGFGRAIWRGKKVDIQIGYDDLELGLVERETRGLKAVRGLDLTYDLVAHVFRGDELIGILTESSQSSRPIRSSDRAAVFAAFAWLERAYIVHNFLIDYERILIDEHGRVRVLDLHCFVYYGRHERRKLEKDAQEYHWDALQRLFDGIVQSEPLPITYPMRFLYPSSTFLATTPTPKQFLLITLAFDFPPRTAEEEKKKSHRKSSKGPRGTLKTITVGPVPLGPKANSLVLKKMSHSGGYTQPPPPYSKLPLPHERPHFRRVLLVPPEDTVDGGGSIVEVS
ncbi:hypothetical protein B0H11DRAFT_2068370 [Mycena galericulata]|nr:hypothetical protein B0H11DRAFT_2068370 [Mycena galericulata]